MIHFDLPDPINDSALEEQIEWDNKSNQDIAYTTRCHHRFTRNHS